MEKVAPLRIDLESGHHGFKTVTFVPYRLDRVSDGREVWGRLIAGGPLIAKFSLHIVVRTKFNSADHNAGNICLDPEDH